MDDATTTALKDKTTDSKDAITKQAPGAFAILPDEIIEFILSTCDPNSFASLILLNRNWRRVSQQAQLYAQQLSRCRSYATSHPAIALPVDDDQLPTLRKAFAHEVKRNLYEAYLRPQETEIKLVSTSISSSAALPGGEAFHFAFSSNGQYVLAYSTSRIHVLHFSRAGVRVEHELKILRRPASIAILDDGSLLAVLSIDHQVDLYDLSDGKPKHIRAIALDHHPRTISLSPGGSVLAAAYDGGIEVYSLTSTALATDKRGVKSDAADSLSFSKDGMQLLGTTIQSKNPNTVILTAPYFNPGEYSPEDSIGQLWATSILFPNSSRDCSHAVLLPSATDCGANWTFTYDRAFETFRAVRIDDLRNGTTYFTGPVAHTSSSSKLLPNTLPATTGSGDLVSAGFKGNEIWCYGVPEDLDAHPELTAEANLADGIPPGHKDSLPGRGHRDLSTDPKDTRDSPIPKWQELCDRSRNAFIQGRHISSLEGISALKWVTTSSEASSEQLIAAAPGGLGQAQGHSFDLNEDGIAPMDGGRLLLLDFSYSIVNGQKRTITIEVGEKDPEVLEEERRDIETEVAIIRRRTVAQSRGNQPAVLRSTTIAARPDRGPVFNLPRRLEPFPITALRRSSITKTPLSPTDETSETASMTSIDEQEALDAPYAHSTPRSGTTLRRAATAAAINRVLHPPRMGGTQGPVQMRPPDGRNELPHESDADNWVPPPPPYSRDVVPPLPEHLRNAIQVGVTGIPTTNLHRSSTQRSSASTDSNTVSSLRRSRTTYGPNSRPSTSPMSPPLPLVIPRPASSSSAVSASSDITRGSQPYPATENTNDFDDMYDVSPQRTPEPIAAVPVAPVRVNQILRRPVGQPVVVDIPETPITNVPSVEPVSPVPRRAVPNLTVQNISVISDHWDGVDDTEKEPSPNGDRAQVLTEDTALANRTQANTVPAQMPQGTRLMQLPSLSPITPLDLHYPPIGTAPSQPIPDSSSDLPAPLPSEVDPVDVNPPSASLLARLNSRGERSNSLRQVDQPRLLSGSFQQPYNGHPSYQNTIPEVPNPAIATGHFNQTRYTDFGPPRAAVGAYATQPSINPIYATAPHMQSNQGRYPSPYDEPGPFSTDSFRPQMSRLETIYSIGSNGDAPPHTSSWPGAVGVSRRVSRAERSAAINMQQAKQRGWRGTMKKKSKKKKDRDAASSAGWTDVTTNTFASEPGKRERSGKCAVM